MTRGNEKVEKLVVPSLPLHHVLANGHWRGFRIWFETGTEGRNPAENETRALKGDGEHLNERQASFNMCSTQ
jgi:hypothetical protein